MEGPGTATTLTRRDGFTCRGPELRAVLVAGLVTCMLDEVVACTMESLAKLIVRNAIRPFAERANEIWR
jgi:hypothetical protein